METISLNSLCGCAVELLCGRRSLGPSGGPRPHG